MGPIHRQIISICIPLSEIRSASFNIIFTRIRRSLGVGEYHLLNNICAPRSLTFKNLILSESFHEELSFKYIYINVDSHTQHTLFRSSITCQIDSASSIGHHQAIIQEHECIQKLRNIRQELCRFYIKILLKCV